MKMQLDLHRAKGQYRAAALAFAVLASALFTGILFTGTPAARAGAGVAADVGVDVGYVDFPFGPAQTPTPSSEFQDLAPTASKPQSKLWFNDGFWWGAMLNGTTHTYNIYKLDLQTQVWTDTGTLIDSRSTSYADCLWDGTNLYVATAVRPGDPGNTAIHVLRYAYNGVTKTYALTTDSVPASGGVEAVVVDRDSTGTIWVSYTLDTAPATRAVYVTHSTTGGTFITPYIIPVGGSANLTSDDISAIVAFNGKIGVMWSNQTDDAIYFAIHVDGTGETAWQGSAAYIGPNFGDDHINLKSLNADPAGQVFAVIKTSLNDMATPVPDAPLLVVLVLPQNGSWYARTFSRVQDRHTRPLLLIDTTNRQVYVFSATNSGEVPSAIYYKQSSLDNVSFPVGPGTPFIVSSNNLNVNNPTSTKQNLTAVSGLLVEASDLSSGYYLHNFLNLPGSGGTASPTSNATQPPSSTVTPQGSPTATACPITFTDVPPESTFYSYIRCLACRGIISGYADGTFRPNNEVTRGQLAKIVSNSAGYTESPDPQIFEDVPASSPFYIWINRLARRGHMSGYLCGGVGEPCITGMPYFRSFANATRGQTSKIVANAAGFSEIPTEQTFEDVLPSHTFYREIQRLASRNIMGGYPCGGQGEPCLSGKPYFRPQNNVTRGQSAKIVANTFFPNCQIPAVK